MTFKRKKYIDLILYILTKCYNKPNFGKTVLCSLLYFTDFNYYELYGKLLTNEIYIKSKTGIEPKHFFDVCCDLINNKQVYLRKEPYYHMTINKYYLTKIPNIKFNPQELEIINYSINKLSNRNATSITKYAIKDPPISMAKFGERIDSRYVFSRNQKYSMIKNK